MKRTTSSPAFAPSLALPLAPCSSFVVCAPRLHRAPTPLTPKLRMTAPLPTEAVKPTETAKKSPAIDPPARFELPNPLPVPSRLPTLGHDMAYKPKGALRDLATSFRLFKQVRGRLSKNTILTVRLSGDLTDRTSVARPFATPELSLPLLTEALRLAAYDPRIAHVHLRIDPLSCGWGKILELRRHLEFFAAAGKTVSAFVETGGPKEFFLAMGFALYVAPEGALNLRGFTSSATFVRGVLDKIGVLPQVERIGKYKSFGDTLMRTTMAPEQREVIAALLGEVHRVWSESVCQVTDMSMDDLSAFVDRSPWRMSEYVDAGLITGLCYETDLEDALKLRFKRPSPFGERNDDAVLRAKLPAVDVFRYVRRATPRLLGVGGRKSIAVIRAVGAITGGKNGSSPLIGATVGSDTLVQLIRRVREDKRFVGVILRCDSPGGAALASDIVWQELRALRAVKPVVASQSDVAASGGYYLSMACEIVAEPLTITGSVGVVTAKPSLAELYRKIGYTKENISVGSRYAELLVDDRPFSEEEFDYFREGARIAYDQFVSKAAQSRQKSVEDMETVAQGRVWTGLQARDQGLVDHIGGMWRAIEVLKERCDISDDFVKLEEIRPPTSFLERFGSGLGTTSGPALLDNGGAGPMLNAGTPLAMAEIDGNLSGVSPLSKAVMDIALAPLVVSMPMLGRLSGVLEQVLKTLISS